MSQLEINTLYDFIYPLAIKAGEILLEGFNAVEKNIEKKQVYYDMVTEYDTKIENFLMKEIHNIYPDHKFIGEEETATKGGKTSDLTDAPTWIIDPIDGTSNFIKKLPHTCVSIGLAINKEIVLGIVNNPILSEIYTAKKGQGAFLNGKSIKCSDCRHTKDAILGYEVSLLSNPKINQKHIKRIYQFGKNATRTVSFASVVTSLCYIACGSLDGYHIEDMYPWDCAAGYLLIREAGGFVYNINGGKFDVMNPNLICGGTESICQELIELIKKSNEMIDIE